MPQPSDRTAKDLAEVPVPWSGSADTASQFDVWQIALRNKFKLILGLILEAALGPAVENIIIAIAVVQTPRTARVARSATIAVRSIAIGDLEVRRDWTDVRDTVRGYWMSLEKGVPGEVYNVGSGHAYTIREMLDVLLSLSKVPIQVKQEECRMRPSDVRILLADCTKFQTQTGWQPQIPFRTTMQDLLDYWRRRV